ncbi:ketopantoate reductase family protein [Acetobacter conturbans]|nr:2-dehydropantoate 2-reductase N-terminal domain-containing protein [Acetobacter conturbans]
MSPASPLRIAILGGGRLGSAFAFHLVRNAHHDVTVIARPDSVRLAQLQRDGGIVTTDGERASTTVTDRFDETVPYDLVTVPAPHTVQLLPSLRRSAARAIQFMLMTFDPEHLQQAVGVERAALGMPFLQSTMDTQGRIKVTMGGASRQTLTSDPYLASIFKAADLPTRYEDRMALWLRCHVPLGVAFESIAVAGERRGGGAPWRRACAGPPGLFRTDPQSGL